jgi:hypothetical protein
MTDALDTLPTYEAKPASKLKYIGLILQILPGLFLIVTGIFLVPWDWNEHNTHLLLTVWGWSLIAIGIGDILYHRRSL